jgi:hypothetical protein
MWSPGAHRNTDDHERVAIHDALADLQTFDAGLDVIQAKVADGASYPRGVARVLEELGSASTVIANANEDVTAATVRQGTDVNQGLQPVVIILVVHGELELQVSTLGNMLGDESTDLRVSELVDRPTVEDHLMIPCRSSYSTR